MSNRELDRVGVWTEIKIQILREYAAAYSTILRKQGSIHHYAYIDGFAGAGAHISKATGAEIKGSPAVALQYEFSHYHFVDLSDDRADRLGELAQGRANVSVYKGDCNDVLLKEVFPTCRYEDFRRALCLLDPYQLNPNWRVVETAGKMKSIEIFLNFMIMDANMNVLWVNQDAVAESQVQRMNDFWGDDSWRSAAYETSPGLFGDMHDKLSNDAIAAAYQKRLKDVAGFRYVPKPLPMRNDQGAIVYYLFFASNNESGNKIANSIFSKYRKRGQGYAG